MRYLKRYENQIFEQESQGEIEEINEIEAVSDDSGEESDVYAEILSFLEESIVKADECIEECGDDEKEQEVAKRAEEGKKVAELLVWSINSKSPSIEAICDSGTSIIKRAAEYAAQEQFNEYAQVCIRIYQAYEKITGDSVV